MSVPSPFRRESRFDPFQLTESRIREYELYEEDGEFVLTVELPGFAADEITVAWDEGVLNVVAERERETRGQRRAYCRRFRLPRDVDDDGITGRYENGVLEVRLPIAEETPDRGRTVPVEA